MSERITSDIKEPVSAFKVPPHSVEAEQAVLGGLMLDNAAWDNVAEILQPRDFYRHEHQIIFEVMMNQVEAGKPIDVVTLVGALDSLDQVEEAGGIEYLSEIGRASCREWGEHT